MMNSNADEKSGQASETQIKLPGFGLPYNTWGEGWYNDAKKFSAVGGWSHAVMTMRERCMLSFMNQITDKPDWSQKVHDRGIVSKWKQEALELDWEKAGLRYGDMSETMFEYCIQELQAKASLYEQTRSVLVLDVTSGVLKSDCAIPSELKDRLKRAIIPLENVPEQQKDWHPGSDGKVLNLVHPSLCPLIYQCSRILPNSTINLDNCLQSIGKGVVIPDPLNNPKALGDGPSPVKFELWSSHFQWLPCNVSFPDGDNATIDSYINNLHPDDNRDLYHVIEEIINKAIPFWNIVYQCIDGERLARKPRIQCNEIEFKRPKNVTEEHPPIEDEEGMEAESWDRSSEHEDWLHSRRTYIKPEPETFEGLKITEEDFKNKFAFLGNKERKIQVIVKLANIHLTPERPDYVGGTWHIEGQLNEHIIATALYYYDNNNITDSYLSFRTGVDSEQLEEDLLYEQDDFAGIEQIFGIENGDPNIQELGSILTREDRFIVFPNGFQHRVGGFKLADLTKPGHRKILALFLVAPTLPVISTANVPPQQRDWWVRELSGVKGNRVGELPTELVQIIGGEVQGFPIGMEEAKQIREELMAERGRMDRDVEHEAAGAMFSFCEH